MHTRPEDGRALKEKNVADKNTTNNVAFRLYLQTSSLTTQNHLIDAVHTVCASVYHQVDQFEVVDADTHDHATDNIRVRPALVRVSPKPERYYFGDLTDPERLHAVLSEDR